MGTPKFPDGLSRSASRRTLLFAAMSAGLCTVAGCAHQPNTAPTVLFVCRYGTVKSAVARELLRRNARARGVAVTVMSRGIEPADHMTDPLKRRLQTDAIDPTRDIVTRLDAETLAGVDIVVLFDSLPPGFSRADARNWSDMPSMNEDYDRAREFLDPRIDALLAEVARLNGARR